MICDEMKRRRVALNISVKFTRTYSGILISALNLDYILNKAYFPQNKLKVNLRQPSGGSPYDKTGNLFLWAQVPGQGIKLLIWILG